MLKPLPVSLVLLGAMLGGCLASSPEGSPTPSESGRGLPSRTPLQMNPENGHSDWMLPNDKREHWWTIVNEHRLKEFGGNLKFFADPRNSPGVTVEGGGSFNVPPQGSVRMKSITTTADSPLNTVFWIAADSSDGQFINMTVHSLKVTVRVGPIGVPSAAPLL